MINELHSLSKALDSNGIAVNEWHRKYKQLPKTTAKSPCIRIWLDDCGMVCGLESLPPALVSEIRKYGNNQSSFPGFNIRSLYRITAPDVIEKLEKIKSGKTTPDAEEILSWCIKDNWIKDTLRNTNRSMNERVSELVELCKLDSQTCAIAALAKLCQKSGDGFRASLEKCIFDKLRKQEDVSLVLSLLFHIGSEGKEPSDDAGNTISVILDVYNWDKYGYPVASEHTTVQLNALLLAKDNSSDKTEDAQQIDAFGLPFVNPKEPMPSVRIPGFDVTLRSMFDGQPSQCRYGKINDESYPISKENRSSTKKALEWIAQPSNKQTTWVKLDKNEIAFIYPSRLPTIPPKFASIFGQEKTVESIPHEGRFERAAKDFAEAFKGTPPEQTPDIIQIFTIRKIDKARSKVLFTRNATPQQLIGAAESWSMGCKNLPSLELGEADTPFPLEAADILNAVYKRDGERADGKAEVKRMKYYQGIELLLDALPSGAVSNYLHIAVQNNAGRYMQLGNQLHGVKKTAKKREDKKLTVKEAACAQSLAVLGLLLYKCDERKENYMEEFAFLLGQWLHVSDELHALYCKVNRNGDIPPQLAGNALLVKSGEMPYQALAQLHVRMNPFTSWAKQYRYQNVVLAGEESWRAGWLLNLFEMLADKLYPQMNESVRFGDFDKAKLYIGYMATLPKREKPAIEKNIEIGDNEND